MTQSSFKSPKSYRWTAGLNRLSFAAIGVGIIAFIIGLATDPQRAWALEHPSAPDCRIFC